MDHRNAPNFIIYTLPRSRSAWLQLLMAWREDSIIGHDYAMTCGSVDEFLTSFQRGLLGTVETGAICAHRLIKEANPKIRQAVIFRDPFDVLISLRNHGIEGLDVQEEIFSRFAMMQELASLPGVFHCEWQQLSNYVHMKQLWRHCNGEAFTPPLQKRWEHMCTVNVQVKVPDIRKYLGHRETIIRAMKADVIERVSMMKARGEFKCVGLN